MKRIKKAKGDIAGVSLEKRKSIRKSKPRRTASKVDPELYVVINSVEIHTHTPRTVGVGKGTLHQHRLNMLEYVNTMFDNITASIRGHEVSIATIYYPGIHVVHDDENLDNPKINEIRTKIIETYNKNQKLVN